MSAKAPRPAPKEAIKLPPSPPPPKRSVIKRSGGTSDTDIEMFAFSFVRDYHCFMNTAEEKFNRTKTTCKFRRINHILKMVGCYHNKTITNYVFQDNCTFDKCPLLKELMRMFQKPGE